MDKSLPSRPILVVDDLAANLLAMEVALAPLNRRVVTAGSGTEALGRLLAEDFCLLLLDVQMPDLDGFDTAAMIRARKRSEHLPIIFVTAHDADPETVRRAYKLGAVDFLAKPFDTEILRAKAAVFVMLQDQADRLAAEQLQQQELRHQVELQQAHNDELAELDRRKDSFLAVLAHELRNPLAPVRTAIELLLQDPGAVDRKLLGVLDRQTRMLHRLVDDLLDVSRIKANKLELVRAPTDVRDIVETAVVTCTPQIQARKHELAVELPPADVALFVDGDALRLAQVVTNLLTNAARYMDPGGQIRLVAERDGDQIAIRVIDRGIGIPSELLDEVFTMFVQERVRSDGFGGLGLGLALARELVELHGGTIGAASEGRGRGSTFEVRLPRLAEPPADAPRKLPTGESAPLAKPAPRRDVSLRIVVVDDNTDARELLCDLLAARGHVLTQADDGPSGRDLIARERPDVALVDLGLPGLDGYALVEALRQSAPDLPTRFIALTGYGSSDDRDRTRAAGFAAHLVKPTNLSELLAALVPPPPA